MLNPKSIFLSGILTFASFDLEELDELNDFKLI